MERKVETVSERRRESSWIGTALIGQANPRPQLARRSPFPHRRPSCRGRFAFCYAPATFDVRTYRRTSLRVLHPLPRTQQAASSMPNARVLRDIKARHGVNANEILRRAYLYVARNQTLPAQVRFQAQLQLNTFGRYTRPTTVKNRCIETGRGRGIINEFGLCRVRTFLVVCSRGSRNVEADAVGFCMYSTSSV